MRIGVKLIVISEAVLLVAVIALVIPLRQEMHEQTLEQMQGELRAIAANAAPLIDGDLHEVLARGGPGAEEAFRTLRAKLTAIRDRNGLDYEHIYTFYRDGDQVRFGVMTHATPFVGDAYTLQPGMREVFADGRVRTTELYRDQHGQWISAYAPIRNSAGKTVGILEVDLGADEYFARLDMVTWIFVLSTLAALAVSSLLGWRVLDALVIRPVRVIRAGVVALGRQQFGHRVDLDTGDEFEELGDTLNSISTQLNAARIVQSSFIPRTMPSVPGWRVAGVSDPCDAAGGDYLDAFALEHDRLGVVVADVSGHGLGPSLLMASCRSALRALSAADLPPGALVEQLHEMMRHDLAEGRFITLVYGVLAPDGTFVYANAGHGPALAVQGGSTHHLAPHRPPLGIDIALTGVALETTITLDAGDRILLATDGLSEAMSETGAFFGVAPIEQAAADGSCSCAEVVTRLRDALRRHCAGPSRTDDVTILCVERTDAGAS